MSDKNGRGRKLGSKQVSKRVAKGSQYRKSGISQLMRNFILCYMANGHNATRAAISAGYSPNGADVVGWKLIHQHPLVGAEVQRLLALRIKKSEISAGYVLSSLKEIADACKVRKVETNAQGEPVEKGVVDSAGDSPRVDRAGVTATERTPRADASDPEGRGHASAQRQSAGATDARQSLSPRV